MKKLIACIEYLETFVGRWWYGLFLFFCAALDHYVLVFPILGMLASSIFLAPKKWLSLSIWSALGSWAGILCLGWLTQQYGISFIQNHFTEMFQTSMWAWAQDFFQHHGLWLLLVVGLAPLPLQPAVIIVALAGTSFPSMAAILIFAKLVKFGIIGYLSSHAPQKLLRWKEVRGELQDFHVKPVINEQES
jgi:membrane protein YqaA with SNARE-associated domain